MPLAEGWSFGISRERRRISRSRCSNTAVEDRIDYDYRSPGFGRAAEDANHRLPTTRNRTSRMVSFSGCGFS